MKNLDEKTMIAGENRIPLLAEEAVKSARNKALTSGLNVVEAVDGKLIESHPDGSYKVIRSIPAPIPVVPGQRRILSPK